MKAPTSHPLARPRTTLFIECRTCKQPWVYSEIDGDGNGPCCQSAKLVDSTELMLIEMARIKGKLQYQIEQIRVLQAANKSLARMASPEVTDLIDAVRAWKVATDPGMPNGAYAAEQRLLAALAAVEESKQ